MQARSPVRSTLELHRNKSLTVFSCDVVRLGGGAVEQSGGAGSDTLVPSS